MDFEMTEPQPDPAALAMKKHITHLHGCCLHEYRESFDEIVPSDSFSGEDPLGRWIMLLVHPRWCPSCITQRTFAITAQSKHFLLHLRSLAGTEEAAMRANKVNIAYAEGGCAGRIAALTISLADFTAGDEPSIGDFEVEELVEDLADVLLAASTTGEVENVGDLTAMLGGEKLRLKEEIDDDFEQAFAEEEARERGYKECSLLQLKHEYMAFICTDMERRKHLLEMALV